MKTVLMQNSQATADGGADAETVAVPSQFLTRVGKQRFLDRSKRGKKEDDDA